MNIYLLVSSIVFLFWGILWTKKDLANLVVKLVFFGLGIWGLVLTGIAYGLVAKI